MATEKQKMGEKVPIDSDQEKHAHLKKLLDSFDTAMLVTVCNDKLRARPMAIGSYDDKGDLWFVTGMDSPKVAEANKDNRIVATFEKGQKYLSISGHSETVKDQAKINEIWKDAWKAWFPGGKTDPNLCLLRVRAEEAEYWDNTGTKGIKYFMGYMAALAKGTTVEDEIRHDPNRHAKLEIQS